MKVFVIQTKNRIMIYVGVRVKNKMIGVFVKMTVCEILSLVIVNVIRHVKLTNIYILKNFHAKLLLGKLAFACEDGILNTTETSLEYKKCKKKTTKKQLPYSLNFVGNYILFITYCHFY